MAQLTLAFLDAFQAALDSQPITRFGSNINQGLLVYLALQSERPFSREALAALFWPEEPDSVAKEKIRKAVYQLRKVLGDLDASERPHLLVTRQTVQFDAGSDYTLDVDDFLGAVERGDLEAAVDLYHGDLLPGFAPDSLPFEEWLRLERERLHQVALEAMFEVTQAHLSAERLDKAQTVARRQLAMEPWREQAYRQLMKAFALAGDRANALAQYELCRDQLWEELAVEPAPETEALHEAIKSGQFGPVLSTESIQPPSRTRHNLPVDTLPFVGRELELEQLTSALTHEGRRLVTLLGPGGMGKTRLAITVGWQLLEQFGDGVYFVDLAPVAHAEEILLSVAVAISYQAPDKNQELKPQLLESLSRRHQLLILDNFEHLMSEAGLVNEILQACPNVSILVTSRQRLNLVSESLYELGGLAFPDGLTPESALVYPAVQLFVESGHRVQSRFTLTDNNVQDVIRICWQVQGMPLGLILAANWLEMLSPAEIAAEIRNSLDFLAAELSDLPERQRSMQAVFERSWATLSEQEQRVMARLSVFRGGFSREAAEQVAGANLRILLGLVNKSFLQRQPDSGRYLIHELLRQFAAKKRRQLDAADEASLVHCRYFTHLVVSERRRSLFFYPLHLARHYAADRDNVLRAWDYALENALADELSGLAMGVIAYGDAQGVRGGHLPGLAIEVLRNNGLPVTSRAMLHLRLDELGYRVEKDEPELNQQRLLELLPLLEEKGDLELLFWAYERLRFNSFSPFQPNPETFEWLDKEEQAALKIGDQVFTKMTQVMRYWIHSGEDELDEAPIEQMLALLSFFEQEYSDTIIFFGIVDALSEYYSQVNDWEQALYYGKLNLNRAKNWQELFWIGFASTTISNFYVKLGQIDQAAETLLGVIDWHLAIGQVWQTLGAMWGAVTHADVIGREFGTSILSMVYHHPEAIPYYRHRIDEARPQFEEEMGAETFAAAWEAGKSLDFDTAVAQMRAALGAGQDQ